jgi:hypothetical protein
MGRMRFVVVMACCLAFCGVAGVAGSASAKPGTDCGRFSTTNPSGGNAVFDARATKLGCKKGIRALRKFWNAESERASIGKFRCKRRNPYEPAKLALRCRLKSDSGRYASAYWTGAFDRALASGRKSCGTYKSTSAYDRARVIAIRGVSCPRARRVAKRFDRKGKELARWQCGLAHDALPRLFSCGKGGSGSLQDSPHALVAKGVGEPA